jgi:hypothetical protein
MLNSRKLPEMKTDMRLLIIVFTLIICAGGSLGWADLELTLMEQQLYEEEINLIRDFEQAAFKRDTAQIQRAHFALSQNEAALILMKEKFPRIYYAYDMRTLYFKAQRFKAGEGAEAPDTSVEADFEKKIRSRDSVTTLPSNKEFVENNENSKKPTNRERVMQLPNQDRIDNRTRGLSNPIQNRPSNREIINNRLRRP